MFKSQGLFRDILCPDSTCSFEQCPFDHTKTPNGTRQGSDGSTSPENSEIEIIEVPHKRSPVDEGRSRKKRFIEKSPTTSSSTSDKVQDELQKSVVVPKSGQRVSETSQSSAKPNMLSVLPMPPVGHGLPVATSNTVPTLTPSDMKRKYTDTFNLAAKKNVRAPSTVPTPSPIPDSTIHPSINDNVRRIPLEMMFKAYSDLYKSLPDSQALSSRDSAAEELFIAKSSPNAHTYQVAWKQQYAKLKKRAVVTSVNDTCTLHDLEKRQLEAARAERWNAPLQWKELSPLVHSKEELARWGYIVDIPSEKPFRQDDMVSCSRCGTTFTPKTRTQYPCIAHWGKQMAPSSITTHESKFWSCCQKPLGSRGCTTHPCHVRKVSQPGELQNIRPFTELQPFLHGQHFSVVSLDCEMAYTLNGMEMVRLTVLDETDQLVIDVLVRAESEVTDYNTRFSGITREMFETQNSVSFDEAIEMLKLYVSKTTIIIGHGLENDLTVLRLVHHQVIDTAILYPHARGRPYRIGLKDLVRRETGVDIQMAGEEGHSSHEDAAAASLLVRKKARLTYFPGANKVKINRSTL